MSKELILEEGKYTYIQHESGGAEALRYGEHWRDLTGDKFIGAMADRIEELERERDAFYMDYRIKCDEEAKDSALVIIERDQLRTEMNEWRGQAHRSQSDADRLKEENDKLLEQVKMLRDALDWYGDEAKAIAKNMENKNDTAILASVTVLALDAGNRAALATTEPRSTK